MPCSICRYSGHNKSTCVWADTPGITDHKSFVNYLNSEKFYVDSINGLLDIYSGLEDNIYNIEEQICYLKYFVNNYTVFDKKTIRVTDKKKLYEECSICMEKCNNIKQCYQCHQCNNVIHSECADKWMETCHKKTCPLCRTSWGIKTRAPIYYHNLISNHIHGLDLASYRIVRVEKYILDTLRHYLNNKEFKHDQNIISKIPSYIQEHIFDPFVLQKYPVVTNGNSNLFAL
jgi:hypothetical protein